jgi:hypothetical protein
MNRRGAISVAVIVPTPELLERMLEEKPACWTWAAFASTVFQRWAAVEQRKVDQVLGSPVTPTHKLGTGSDVAQFVIGHMRDVDGIVAQVSAFLSGPAFREAFGAPDDEDSADAEGIIRAAHHLGDCYERLLELAEECRRCSVSAQYAELLHDCVRFVNQHLQDFGGFVNDILENLEDLQKRVMLGERLVHCQRPALHTNTDDRLIWSILDRVRTIE